MYPPVPVVYEDVPRTRPVDQLADRLLERRMILVTGRLDDATASDASARLLLLDGSGDEPVDLLLSCDDGDLMAATALADTVELVGVEVRALATGTVGGPAVLPYALAGRRLAQPHATFRLAEPRLELDGRATDIEREAVHHADVLASMHVRLAAVTGQTAEQIAADLRSRRVLTATEAKAYGLVDDIAQRRHLQPVE
jgi:ATP-dependent Clp protease protease subunit